MNAMNETSALDTISANVTRVLLVEDDVAGQRSGRCAHHEGGFVAGLEVFGCDAAERTLVEIERPGQHPGERHERLMFRRAAEFIPLVVFEVQHPFVVE